MCNVYTARLHGGGDYFFSIRFTLLPTPLARVLILAQRERERESVSPRRKFDLHANAKASIIVRVASLRVAAVNYYRRK